MYGIIIQAFSIYAVYLVRPVFGRQDIVQRPPSARDRCKFDGKRVRNQVAEEAVALPLRL